MAVFKWVDTRNSHFSEDHFPEPMIFGDTHDDVQERAYEYIEQHPECMPLNPDWELTVEVRQIPDWFLELKEFKGKQ